MRRYILLVVVVALATLIFAPVAVAQDDNPSADDRGMDDRGFEDKWGGGRTYDDNPGAHDRSFNDQGFDDHPTGADDRGFDDSGSGSHTFDDNPDADDRGSNNRVFDDNPSADDAMTSPTASASAASGAAGDDDVFPRGAAEHRGFVPGCPGVGCDASPVSRFRIGGQATGARGSLSISLQARAGRRS